MATSTILEIKDIVNWLKSIEHRVGFIYTKAAGLITNDKEFVSLLQKLADDEKLHESFMQMVSKKLDASSKTHLLDVILDEYTVNEIEGLLTKFENFLTNESVSKKQIIEYMTRTESCELNPVFLYVAGTFGMMNRETEYITSEIQSHLRRIQAYIDTLNADMKPSFNLDLFTSIWDDKFLVVDDNEPLCKLVHSMLSSRCNAEMASDGLEGMVMIKKHFYNGIITDIDMPGMDGLEFYMRAIEYDPRLQHNFIFYSADINPNREAFMRKNDLPFLKKPFGLTEFNNVIDKFIKK